MGLFSKKPGGTFFGNLLRGVANKATGGLLGTGANRIEVGQTKTNAQLYAESEELTKKIAEQQQELARKAGEALGTAAIQGANPSIGTGGNNILVWLLGIGLVVVVFFKDKIFKKKSF
ncbi:hypothetical protein DBR40_19920 [Pedobacter sp. KBW01]|uniref:hypothetical protein n=1 Tax=Pedobacter sp. KBW01 TaxID=2153364 RepID=UPI000F597932|nr:hypothetical protein [Pedobacter sp. KBW01]RQO68511.1 hypothetical protein DBR40_19920 [Pedobacter sp. KBW01]